MVSTVSQKRGNVVRHARANLRYEQLIQMSAEGVSRADAARALRMSESGVNGILYAKLGTTQWPIDAALSATGAA